MGFEVGCYNDNRKFSFTHFTAYTSFVIDKYDSCSFISHLVIASSTILYPGKSLDKESYRWL